ncbi:uncharacterized protein G2W53_000941 [Senna tora]|uniref:Uncharacterized protein n=1 Tax=Senna tora TaxID=362788 RepID=A0A835CJX6_9FABA|nr:uncharacterized protein G2W53_000941 [Senna tora]
MDFSEQLNHFNEVYKYLVDTYGEKVAHKVLSKSIYIFSLGVGHFINLQAKNYASVGETSDAIFDKLKLVIKVIKLRQFIS